MSPQALLIRRISPSDSRQYHALRQHSLESLAYALEPQIVEELGADSVGIEDLLRRYDLEGTQVWGVFDQHVLTGVLGLSRPPGLESFDAALLWGVHVLPRYRGTAVSRLLMESAIKWCKLDLSIRWMTTLVDRGNVPARRYLERFGFEQASTDGDEREKFRTLCMRRQT